jgi:hypothetical protein
MQAARDGRMLSCVYRFYSAFHRLFRTDHHRGRELLPRVVGGNGSEFCSAPGL